MLNSRKQVANAIRLLRYSLNESINRDNDCMRGSYFMVIDDMLTNAPPKSQVKKIPVRLEHFGGPKGEWVHVILPSFLN
jgi:hypothetical protein